MDKETFKWYEENASSYSLSTKDALVEDALNEFVSLLPKEASIVDIGCGCGRDSAYFRNMGFRVESMDVSPAMAREARRLFDIDVSLCDVLSLERREELDGAWAQASLLHLNEEELSLAFRKIRDSLKDGGILYASFRIGEGNSREEGRYYTNMTKEKLLSLLPKEMDIIRQWESKDVRKGMAHRWLSSIMKKRSVAP